MKKSSTWILLATSVVVLSLVALFFVSEDTRNIILFNLTKREREPLGIGIDFQSKMKRGNCEVVMVTDPYKNVTKKYFEKNREPGYACGDLRKKDNWCPTQGRSEKCTTYDW